MVRIYLLITDVTHVSRFCHAEEADRLTKHLLPLKYIDSSTPLRSAQNDRHIILCLCVTSVNKAKALEEKLSFANPLSKIQGYPVGIPLNSCSDEAICQALADAHVFVDCTTSDTAFDWLNQYAVENNKRLISLFFNFHAELLTICISGDSTSCGDIFADLNHSIQQNQTPLDPKIYFFQPSKEEQIIEGAGCWHPSFPALNAHVQILSAHAVDILGHYIDSKEKIGLAAIVKRQSVTQNGVQPGSLVEVVWKKEY